MPSLTLNQAAKASRKAKATLLDAIRNGRMSTPKDDLGRYCIDPAELFRVYPQNQSDAGQDNRDRPHEETSETIALRTAVEHLRELVQQIEHERDDLRRCLDSESEERRAVQNRLTALLTEAPRTPPRPFWAWFWPW
jgi:uncharacterized protein YlxW (UPF0749 family)